MVQSSVGNLGTWQPGGGYEVAVPELWRWSGGTRFFVAELSAEVTGASRSASLKMTDRVVGLALVVMLNHSLAKRGAGRGGYSVCAWP